ncbi:hypothetical protein PR003_g22610 [Phytophthora rubi]|uniref:Uncharacterized protein n=1 Tax=Phytophthora rubi TaxID=129364 RepID=A0A6A3IUE9_9STRA|nr:hypothetical protein PR002_g23090 [Phytophthora rubi]KAE8990791.1 hypothetical protein PR001_g21396 [Phytophthora rubi]KAE9301088.1 hypothetical protein PR003_g22610 [Phytophthora rubi]
MEVDVIQHYGGRRVPTSLTRATTSSSTRSPRPMRCFRYGKPGHNAVEEPPPPSPPVLRAHLFTTTSGSDSRLIGLSLHGEGAKLSLRALLDLGATNNFVRAESLSVFPADLNIREGLGDMIVEYDDGKSRCTQRRLTTFAYELDRFHSSEVFLVIEMSGSSDCVFWTPWLARHQPGID